ncbi:hypothetical protein SBF1_7630005 [Candidatus Desulfosporosinus infrequens]|uniref:Uncharacterized protein n=1 Tax=Candidatus Desulfosporosinus infrequens TaxID=2043169 RepID=A0A2U3LRN8_9FIRM|nr:hypothetical protein SBF1_7630005 [Candidatus Desulfosporosinus infrequens]
MVKGLLLKYHAKERFRRVVMGAFYFLSILGSFKRHKMIIL